MLKSGSNKTFIPLIAGFGLLLVVAISFFIIAGTTQNPSAPPPSPSVSPSDGIHTQTVGTLACLPHKDTKGPITLECAYGLKAESGDYYALDTTFFPGLLMDFAIGVDVLITGEIVSIERAGDTSLQKYDIKGVLRVTDIERQ